MIKVAVDAMGGDLAPVEMVAGSVEAVNAKPGIQVLLVGQETVVNAIKSFPNILTTKSRSRW